jgi:SAM-dependent methyltransferase
MSTSQIHADNGAWWDETAEWYALRGPDESLEFLRSGGSYLRDAEHELLGDLKSWCSRAIHLQCSHGKDALSLWNMGAHEVVGIDISERLLSVAKRLTQELNAPAAWFCSDILSTPAELDETADLVYTGKGALCWMMDLPAWASVVVRLLKPGGRLFIYESHPLDWVWDVDAANFELDREHGDYFDAGCRDRLFMAETQNRPLYKTWTLAEIVNSIIGAGLIVDHLGEYPELFWGQFPHIPEDNLKRLPHTFSLLAHKPG